MPRTTAHGRQKSCYRAPLWRDTAQGTLAAWHDTAEVGPRVQDTTAAQHHNSTTLSCGGTISVLGTTTLASLTWSGKHNVWPLKSVIFPQPILGSSLMDHSRLPAKSDFHHSFKVRLAQNHVTELEL